MNRNRVFGAPRTEYAGANDTKDAHRSSPRSPTELTSCFRVVVTSAPTFLIVLLQELTLNVKGLNELKRSHVSAASGSSGRELSPTEETRIAACSPTGQRFSHRPQPVHSSGWMTGRCRATFLPSRCVISTSSSRSPWARSGTSPRRRCTGFPWPRADSGRGRRTRYRW